MYFPRSLVFALFVISFVCLFFLSPVVMLFIGGAIAWAMAIGSMFVAGGTAYSLCLSY